MPTDAASLALTNCISQEIEKQNGFLPFERYMSLALYHPLYGYYNQPDFTIGRSGDFITAPEISNLFGACFANQIKSMLSSLSNAASILELGAGSGKLAHDLIVSLKEMNSLPTYYYIYEISLELRQKQQSFLQQSLPDYFQRIIWLAELPSQFTGIILANELLDALPIHLFTLEADEPKERGVTLLDGKLAWQTAAIGQQFFYDKLIDIQKKYNLKQGYSSEIHLNLIHLVTRLSQILSKGYLIFADYGYGEKEYYHPERQQGTLTCFYQHQIHHNPLLFPGLSDITAHVNFTAVIAAAHEAGCNLMGYTTQAAFLLACGLMSKAEFNEKNMTQHAAVELHQQIKLLTFPTEMGERIKIMALNKNVECDALGFAQVDLSHKL